MAGKKNKSIRTQFKEAGYTHTHTPTAQTMIDNHSKMTEEKADENCVTPPKHIPPPAFNLEDKQTAIIIPTQGRQAKSRKCTSR